MRFSEINFKEKLVWRIGYGCSGYKYEKQQKLDIQKTIVKFFYTNTFRFNDF